MHCASSLRCSKTFVLPCKLRLLQKYLIRRYRAPASQFRHGVFRLDLYSITVRILIGQPGIDLFHTGLFFCCQLISCDTLCSPLKLLHQIFCRMTSACSSFLQLICALFRCQMLHADLFPCQFQRCIYHIQKRPFPRLFLVQAVQILDRSHDLQPVDGTSQRHV